MDSNNDLPPAYTYPVQQNHLQQASQMQYHQNIQNVQTVQNMQHTEYMPHIQPVQPVQPIQNAYPVQHAQYIQPTQQVPQQHVHTNQTQQLQQANNQVPRQQNKGVITSALCLVLIGFVFLILWLTGVFANSFMCDNGCTIDAAYVNDDDCDCPDCSDENSWSCSTCAGGCKNYCPDSPTSCIDSTTDHETYSSDLWTCNDGCTILSTFQNDDDCDCPDCSDESSWTCSTCHEGCKTSCASTGIRHCT